MDKEILEHCHWLFPVTSLKGSFEFKEGDILRKVNNAPNKFGIYLIFEKKKKRAAKLIYIGKAGSMLQSGTFHGQGLNTCINNVVGQDQRREDFIKKMSEPNLQKIIIYWFVDHNNIIKQIPAYVEAELLQKYYTKNKKLPEWNKEF